jgi:hypothetical protein
MEFPYIKYVETLALGRLSPSQIVSKLSEYGLAFPEELVYKVATKLKTLYPEHFEDTSSVNTELLVEMKVDRMFGYEFSVEVPYGIEGIEGAINIINDPLMYRLVTSLALAKINDEDIELIVNGKFNMSYSHEDIEQFLHYFFDVAGWNIKQKTSFVTEVADKALKRAYKLALDGDKDYLVWKLGAAPDKPVDEMLRDMVSDTYYNFKERSLSNPEDAQRWGALLVKLVDRAEKLEKDTGTKQDIFASFEFNMANSDTREGAPTADDTPRHISELED